MKTKAYSYLRMSTETQLKGDSLRRQLEASQAYAELKGWELVTSIQDIGVSAFKGKNVEQGALGEFIQSIESGVIEPGSVLLVESFDRLSRNDVLPAFHLFASILGKGLKIVTLADAQTYTSESVNQNPGQLFLSLGIMMRANEESEMKSRRLKASWQQKRKAVSSKKLTSICPGWLVKNKETDQFEELSERATETIRTIFDLCIDQEMGAYSITRHLNGHIEKYPTLGRSSHWQIPYIDKILGNPAVYGSFQPHKKDSGKRVPDGKEVENYFPEVISKERYLLAQAKIKERSRVGGGRKGEEFPNIFTKLLKCGNCGAPVSYINKGSQSRRNRYLQCRNSIAGYKCNSPVWKYDDFEDMFLRFITEVDYSEVLDKGKTKSERKTLSDEKLALDQFIETKTTEYETLRKRIADPNMKEELMPDLLEDLTNRKKSIDLDEEKIRRINVKLAELESISTRETRQEILSAIQGMSVSAEDDEHTMFRRRIHGSIYSVVKQVSLFNGETINPWEGEDMMTPRLRAELKRRGVDTQEKMETFLSTDSGKRLVNEATRYFVVYFRSEVTKSVRPFEKFALDNRTMIERFGKGEKQHRPIVPETDQEDLEVTE